MMFMVDGIIFNGMTQEEGQVPLGLSRPAGAHRIATSFRSHGLSVEVVDFFPFWKLSELKRIIESRVTNETLFIAWSLTFLKVAPFVDLELIPWIRSSYPNIKLLVGGSNTNRGDINSADYYIDGYAEGCLPELISHLKGADNDLQFEQRSDGSIYVNALSKYNLSNWGSLTIDYKTNDYIEPHETLTIETSRGCIFKCKFCCFPLIGKKKMDHVRHAEHIRAELIGNFEKFGVRRYYLSEETVNDSVDKLKVIESAVKDLSFKPEFCGFFRADVMHVRPEMIQLLKNINVTGMHFGLESFNKATALAIGKGLSSDKVKQVLQDVREVFGQQVKLIATFIVGLPFESKESILSTQEWLESKNNPLDTWLWLPLMIPDESFPAQQSNFTKNYKSYGYKKLGIYPQDQTRILWKNEFFNLNEAVEFSESLQCQSNPYKKIDPWTYYSCLSAGLSEEDALSYYRGLRSGEEDHRILERVNKQANNYIMNKLSDEKKNHLPKVGSPFLS